MILVRRFPHNVLHTTRRSSDQYMYLRRTVLSSRGFCASKTASVPDTVSPPSPSTSRAAPAATGKAAPQLLPLPRPLGVKEHPSISRQPHYQRLILDKDYRLKERKILCVQIFLPKTWVLKIFISLDKMANGLHKDLIDLRYHEGKTWLAPKTLIREDVCTVRSPSTSQVNSQSNLTLESVILS